MNKEYLFPILAGFVIGFILGAVLISYSDTKIVQEKQQEIDSLNSIIDELDSRSVCVEKECAPVVCNCDNKITDDREITRIPSQGVYSYSYYEDGNKYLVNSYCEKIIGAGYWALKLYLEKEGTCGYQQVSSSHESSGGDTLQQSCDSLFQKFLSDNKDKVKETLKC